MKKGVMKVFFTVCAMLAVILALTFPAPVRAEGKEKVILDSDMVELFDDGVAMLMLAQAPNVELKGVSIVIGNTWVESGTAYAIRQLEGIGRTDIPVYMGVNQVTREGRFENMAEEKKLYGRNFDSHLGAAGYPEPESWEAAYRDLYHRDPEMKPQQENAVDFIVRTVKENPGEVTIVAIGSAANLAKALDKAPEIAPMVKRVVYMAGAFLVEGNVMPHAEFNVWIDPETAKQVYRAPWTEQVFLPLDVCNTEKMSHEGWVELTGKIHQPWAKTMWDNYWAAPLYRADPNFSNYIWDVLAAAVAIDPSVITEEATYPVDVNADYGVSYGETLAFKGEGPEGTQKARIVFRVDHDKVWKMVEDVFDQL